MSWRLLHVCVCMPTCVRHRRVWNQRGVRGQATQTSCWRARSRRPRHPHTRKDSALKATRSWPIILGARSAAARKSGEKLKVTQAYTSPVIIIITMRINNRVRLWEFVWSVFTAVTSLPFTCSLSAHASLALIVVVVALFSNKLLCWWHQALIERCVPTHLHRSEIKRVRARLSNSARLIRSRAVF